MVTSSIDNSGSPYFNFHASNPDANSATQSFTVPYGRRTFYLYNNGLELAYSTVASACATNTTWDGAKCVTIDACIETPPTTCQDSYANNAGGPLPCTYDTGVCPLGAVDYPTCKLNASGACVNGAINPPECTRQEKPTFIEN